MDFTRADLAKMQRSSLERLCYGLLCREHERNKTQRDVGWEAGRVEEARARRVAELSAAYTSFRDKAASELDEIRDRLNVLENIVD